MAGDLQFSLRLRNARADQVSRTIGIAPVLELRSGPPPKNCAAAPAGELLARGSLPNDWIEPAADGSKEKRGAWTLTGLAGIAPTEAGHFRLYDAFGRACDMQGRVTAASGAGPMKVTPLQVKAGQEVVVEAFSLREGNE